MDAGTKEELLKVTPTEMEVNPVFVPLLPYILAAICDSGAEVAAAKVRVPDWPGARLSEGDVMVTPVGRFSTLIATGDAKPSGVVT